MWKRASTLVSMSSMEQDQTIEQASGSQTIRRITVGVPQEDHHGFNDRPIHVYPTDSVDVLNQKFPLTNVGSSTLVQQIFLKAHTLKCDDDDETFGLCNLLDGDIIYLLPTPRDIPVTIQDTLSGRDIELDVPAFLTIGKVQSVLYEEYHDALSSIFFEHQQLIFKHNGEYLLDKSRTVAECGIQDHDTLYLVDIHYNIFVAIPTYGQIMERVVFLPGDTISTIKSTAAAVQLSRHSTAVRMDTTSVILRGAIKNKKGILVYMCLHLFRERMLVHMDESTEEASQPVYRCVLKLEHTVEDIYKMIEKEDGYGLVVVNAANAAAWRRQCVFDYTWTRTFAPKIDVDPVAWSNDKHLPLYFFPCVTHTRFMDDVSSFCTVRNFVESICEKEDMKGVERELCPLDDSGIFEGWLTLFFFHELMSWDIVPFALRKHHQTPLYQRRMKVYVTWPGRLTNPAEVLVEPDDTVICLKDRIENVLKLPISSQVLVFSGEILEDNSAPISSVGIDRDSVVELIPNLPDESAIASKDGTKKELP